MKSLKQFREENGLADVKTTSDVSGPEGELLNDLAELLRNNADTFRHIFRKCLDRDDLDTDTANDLKKLIGIVSHLKDSPAETKEKMRDPLDNVVVRPHNGPDGSDSGNVGES
jgi:hypothetical protein